MIITVFAAGYRTAFAQEIFSTETGRVHFRSEAPLEIIEASSKELKGLIDASKMTFAFSVQIRSFQGFNSPLQREHFNENYMESDDFPRATFAGKIIEQVDLTKAGEYSVRTKGKLHIHGIEQERIIKSTVKVENGRLSVKSSFTVLLQEHGISIPKIVYQKIAEEINVTVEAEFTKAGK